MTKHLLLGLLFMCVFNVTAHAQAPASQTHHRAPVGIGIGALIGGLVAGPPGAIIGAAGGAWFATRADAADTRKKRVAELKLRLANQQEAFVALQNRFARERELQDGHLQQVALQRRKSIEEQLAHGVSLSVYFRTGSAKLNTDTVPNIQKLAQFLSKFPEIQLHLDAYADRRGSDAYNLNLSRMRDDAVRQALMAAGVPGSRIHQQAHGDSDAKAARGDTDGYAFDRRVSIHLTLNTEA